MSDPQVINDMAFAVLSSFGMVAVFGVWLTYSNAKRNAVQKEKDHLDALDRDEYEQYIKSISDEVKLDNYQFNVQLLIREQNMQ